MTEDRDPMFVCCEVCAHEWVGLYLPMHSTRAARIMETMCCPNCGNDSATISIKAKDKADG